MSCKALRDLAGGCVAVLTRDSATVCAPFALSVAHLRLSCRHFVRSLGVSISVNQWIDVAEDRVSRLEEAVARTIVSSQFLYSTSAVTAHPASDAVGSGSGKGGALDDGSRSEAECCAWFNDTGRQVLEQCL